MPSQRQGYFLLVTQDAALARSLHERVKHHGAVAQTSTYDEALRDLTPGSHFVGVIVDLDSCVVPALQAIESLRDAHALVPVLALASSLSLDLVNGIHVRRAELVLKPFNENNIDGFAQRALIEGWLSDEQLAASIGAIAAQCQLTARETDLITHALGNESRQSVILRLGITENTLKAQVRSLLRKCNARSTDKLSNVVFRSALMREISPAEDDEELGLEAHGELDMTENVALATSQTPR